MRILSVSSRPTVRAGLLSVLLSVNSDWLRNIGKLRLYASYYTPMECTVPTPYLQRLIKNVLNIELLIDRRLISQHPIVFHQKFNSFYPIAYRYVSFFNDFTQS